jgi:hypothetical protein
VKIRLSYISLEEQLTNILTKALGQVHFLELREKIDVGHAYDACDRAQD